MKIFPTEDRVHVRLIDPRKDKSEGGIFIPKRSQEDPKVFEAEVLGTGPDLKHKLAADGRAVVKVGDRVLIPGRVLGDRLSDGTVFVRFSEVFGRVEDSKLVEATSSILVPG